MLCDGAKQGRVSVFYVCLAVLIDFVSGDLCSRNAVRGTPKMAGAKERSTIESNMRS